jgi:hypothetical protein
MRRSGTCEPNLSKSTRASRRRPRAGGTQLGERRASRRVTRFNRFPWEVPAFSAGTWLESAASDALRAWVASLSCDSRWFPEHRPLLPPGARVNGPGIHKAQSAFRRRQARAPGRGRTVRCVRHDALSPARGLLPLRARSRGVAVAATTTAPAESRRRPSTSANRRETRARPRATRFPRPPPSFSLGDGWPRRPRAMGRAPRRLPIGRAERSSTRMATRRPDRPGCGHPPSRRAGSTRHGVSRMRQAHAKAAMSQVARTTRRKVRPGCLSVAGARHGRRRADPSPSGESNALCASAGKDLR